MLEITRIDHISMAVPDLDRQTMLLQSLFGFEKTEEWIERQGGYRGVLFDVPGSTVGWEVLAPYSEDSDIARFLEGPHGPGLHHVTLEVPYLKTALEELRAAGVEPVATEEDADEREVYIHPDQGGHGFLFQIREARDVLYGRHDSEAPSQVETPEHAMGICGINHLSHAHTDRDALGDWYERVFGMRTIHRSELRPGADFLTRVLETTTGQMRWEVLAPGGRGSFVQRFLDTRGPSMHHVTFQVSDWEQALSACEQHEVPTFGERDGVTEGARWRETFIHPRHTGGVLVQFYWEEAPGIWI